MTESTQQQQAPYTHKHLWILGILAVLQLLFGVIALSMPLMTGAVSMLVLGIIFIAGALVSIYQCFAVKGFRIWNFVATILYAIVGIYILQNMQMALLSVTLLIGWIFIAGGILRLVTSYKMRGTPGNGWRLFNSIITLLLGSMVIFQWPESSVWLIGTLIAVELIFSGWATLFFSLSAKKAIS
ncbi:MAG: DUF308 domain-containing protein [Akkermansia sp.]